MPSHDKYYFIISRLARPDSMPPRQYEIRKNECIEPNEHVCIEPNEQ